MILDNIWYVAAIWMGWVNEVFFMPSPRVSRSRVSSCAVNAPYCSYRLINHASNDSTALMISIVVTGKKNLNPGRSITTSPGK